VLYAKLDFFSVIGEGVRPNSFQIRCPGPSAPRELTLGLLATTAAQMAESGRKTQMMVELWDESSGTVS
jgi:hypothetical protein